MKRLAALLLLAAAPSFAATSDEVQGQTGRAFAAPSQLSASERENYRLIFAALRASDWAGAAGRLDEMRPGLLHDIARAQLYTMPGSPRVEGGPLVLLLNRAPDLPQAPALARLASTRGVETLPSVPTAQRLYGLPGQPRRARPRPIRGDAVADQLEPLLSPLIRDDKPVEAEALLATRSAELTPEARIAFQQRIAWVYYLNGDNQNARRIADLCRTGSSDYALQAEWVAGLAAWRMDDYADAAAHFADVATRSADVELAALAERVDRGASHAEQARGTAGTDQVPAELIEELHDGLAVA